MESFRGPEFRRSEPAELSLEDKSIRDAILDEEASKALQESNPVFWMRGAIGIDIQRGASTISDRELFGRFIEGGKVEWDPTVVKAVRRYLRSKGF